MSRDTQQQEKRRPDRAALVIAALLMMASVVIAWSTSTHSAGGAYARVGPTTFPYVIAVAFFGLSIWTAIEALRGDFPEREHQEISPILWIVGGLAAQMLLLKVAGFSIATGLLFAATARAFGPASCCPSSSTSSLPRVCSSRCPPARSNSCSERNKGSSASQWIRSVCWPRVCSSLSSR